MGWSNACETNQPRISKTVSEIILLHHNLDNPIVALENLENEIPAGLFHKLQMYNNGIIYSRMCAWALVMQES